MRFINEIRPNRLDTVRKHVISGNNMKKIDKGLPLYYALNILLVKMCSFLKKKKFKTDRLELSISVVFICANWRTVKRSSFSIIDLNLLAST